MTQCGDLWGWDYDGYQGDRTAVFAVADVHHRFWAVGAPDWDAVPDRDDHWWIADRPGSLDPADRA